MPPPPTKSSGLLTENEINWLETKILNDYIGLKLNFTELDYEEQKNYFLLEEKSHLSINVKNGENHLIIEGDNYHALKALKTAGVKVDIIYIDPPYNTGKEFVYNDDYATDPKIVTDEDPHKHSKWLSFMKKRLLATKELLKDNGVIFVSINDKEQSYLKVLMDEIFGENLFFGTLIHQKKSGGGQAQNYYKGHDYIHIFVRNEILKLYQVDHKKFKTLKVNGEKVYYDSDTIRRKYGKYHKGIRRNVYYENLSQHFNSEKVKEIKKRVKKRDYILVADHKNPDNHFICKWWTSKKLKLFYSILQSDLKNGINLWTSAGQKLLDEIMGEGKFPNPKPIDLLKILIKSYSRKDTIVLDFFAGSGTTAQAVMEINEEDGGNRRFIMVNNSETCTNKTNAKIRKTCEENGYHPIKNGSCIKNICRDVCRERVYRVIKGCGSQGQTIKWQYNESKKSLLNNHVRYLKIKYLDRINGQFEELDKVKSLYKEEFQKKLTACDLYD